MSHPPKSLKRKIFEFIWNRFKPSKESQSRLAEYLIPIVEMKIKFGKILFYCPGGRTVGRAKTLLSKEKLTIEWIDPLDGQTRQRYYNKLIEISKKTLD